MNEENNKKEETQDEIQNLKKQAQEYLDGWKRAKADYLNLKKEIESQNKELKGWMAKIFLMPLLNILDNLDKAFGSVPENLKKDEWVKGIEGVKKQFEEYLKSQGVEAMKSVGEKFDPFKHEAVESVEGGESGVVAEEVVKGYSINGEVLRPAKVKVYK